MANPSELLARQTEKRFEEIILASPKKIREEVFRRTGIKSKGSNKFSISKGGKNSVRVQKLFKALQKGTELSSELSEELIRNYLYTRRDLLADALDHFGVEHEHGLTDSELDFLEDMDTEKAQALRTLLCEKHEESDVELYFRFMNIRSE